MASIECAILGFAPTEALEELKVTLVGVAGRKLNTYSVKKWMYIREEDRAFSIPRSEVQVSLSSTYELRLLGRIQRDYDIARAQAVTLLPSTDDPKLFLEALGYSSQCASTHSGFQVETLEGFTVTLLMEGEKTRVEMRCVGGQEKLDDFLSTFCGFARLFSPIVDYVTPS